MVKTNAGNTTLKPSGGILPGGKYHVICESVEVRVGDQPFNQGEQQVMVKMEVHAPDEHKGRSFVDFLPAEGTNRDGSPAASRLFQFARAIGMITEAEHAEWVKEGADVDLDENEFVGLQCYVERNIVKEKSYHTYLHLNDPKAKDFPSNKELLNLLEPDSDAGAAGASSSPSDNGGNNGGGNGQAKQTAGAGASGFNDPDL